jgi:sugar phosphate isomerase/epimerase
MKAVHVKNAMTESGEAVNEMIPVQQIRLDRGILNWPEIVKAITATGYDGYFMLEDFSEFNSLAEKFKWNVDYLRAID